ncbi:LysR substrate-binding domain-containing protein [Facklamia hominis]|uniref:LysR substrate-binding domain-containing protein n=1 Tax=Facklamia hominis TaxID=178214 RepID=UPI0029D41961|nr:LysR substrate-binding domain-containing protein [Facklamia hominis]WPJ91741.1 LysR substrate-binding domain-containing protein [Facklamia hominis]
MTLFQSDTIKVINDIALGSLNLGIVGSQSMNNNLKFERIFQDKLVIATAYNDHFLALQASNPSIQELLRHPFISREDGSGTLKESAMLLREMKIDPLKLDKVLEVNNNEAIKQFIKLGTGISIISELAVINEVKNKEILTFPIDHKLSNRDFYLVHRKNSHLTDASRHFVEFVRKIDLNNLNFDIPIDEEDEDDEDESLNKDKTKKKKTKNSSKRRDFHRMVKPTRIHRKIND